MAQVQLWYLWFTDVMRKVGMCTKQMPLWRALKPQWISFVNIFWLKKKKMPLMMLQDGIYYCIILPWVLRGNRVIITTLETENLLRIKSLWDPIRNMEGILDSMCRNRLSKISQHKNTTLLSQMSPDHVREEPVSEGNPKERGYVYMHNWLTLLYSRN